MNHNKTAVLSSLQRKYDRNDNKQAERCMWLCFHYVLDTTQDKAQA
jgi:hypothetical protein